MPQVKVTEKARCEWLVENIAEFLPPKLGIEIAKTYDRFELPVYFCEIRHKETHGIVKVFRIPTATLLANGTLQIHDKDWNDSLFESATKFEEQFPDWKITIVV